MIPAKTITVTNWGGNMGVRLPKDFTEAVGIRHKSKVQARVRDDAIIITPIKTPHNHIPLADRMERALQAGTWDGKSYGITKEDREWLDMPSVGEEIVW